MNNPSNSEFSSLKPLRLRVIPPKSRKREDEVFPTCQKGKVVINDKYSMPLIEEAIKEDSPLSEETEAELEVIEKQVNDAARSERPKPTCDVCHKSFNSEKAVQGHMRIHPKKPAQKKRVIDECKYPLKSSKKVRLDNSWGKAENRERKMKNHHENLQSKDAMRVSNNIMFLDTRMGRQYTTNQNWSEEEVNGAHILLHMKYGMDWEKYVHQNSHTNTKRLKTEGNVLSSSNAELVMDSDIGVAIWVRNNQRRSTASTQIPNSSVENPIEAESSKDKESSMQIIPYTGNSSIQIPNSSVENPIEAESSQEKGSSMQIIQCTGNSSTQVPTEYKSCNAKEKGKEIMRESLSGKGNHVCSICDKSFSSHQALGGHMTCHRENKVKLGGDGKVHKKNVEREHVCKLCGEVYPTGQQLGGHMRKHYNKNEKGIDIIKLPSINTKEEGKETPVNDKEEGKVAKGDVGDEGMEQARARVYHGFDLNEAAVPMEEDGDHASVT